MAKKSFQVSWKTWEGRRSETVSHEEFCNKYAHLLEPGTIGDYIRELINDSKPGASFGWNEEEGMVTIKHLRNSEPAHRRIEGE
tara:strand:+ start:163 stop:414 length:252 start_codon:yes stop_codon:yes gene_type:complete